MKSSVDTHLGSIQIDSSVITQYAGSIANECFGIVGMASVNPTQGLVRILKNESAGRGVSVKNNAGKLIVDYHIIVAYGVSILAVTENLVSTVKYKLESYTGLEVEKINIFVEGVRVID